MLSTVAAIMTASLLSQPEDFTTIPPDPYEMEQVLASTRVDAAKAIELATAAVGGSCAGIEADVVNESVTFKVVMGTPGGMKVVTVDAQSGAVTAPTISVIDAIKAATQAVDGTVKSVELNSVELPPTYSVVLYANGQQHEMVIDATNGFVNTTVSTDRFPGLPLDGAEFVTEPSGLMYADIVEGTGATPSGPSARVTVHYTGYLVDGKEFDSSYSRNQPATFPLGGVIKGWTEGVGGMSVGGKRKLVIPYELAYGAQGRAPVIPPKATLIFDVELISIDE